MPIAAGLVLQLFILCSRKTVTSMDVKTLVKSAEFVHLSNFTGPLSPLKLEHGFPRNAEGMLFATEVLTYHKCDSNNPTKTHRTQCNATALSSLGYPKACNPRKGYGNCSNMLKAPNISSATFVSTVHTLSYRQIEVPESVLGILTSANVEAYRAYVDTCIAPNNTDAVSCAWPYFARMRAIAVAIFSERSGGWLNPLIDTEYYSAMLVYFLCQNTANLWPELCPDPCRNYINPCGGVAHSLSHQCVRTGVFRDSYRCVCRSGYKWYELERNCVKADKCSVVTSSEYPCHVAGTAACLFAPGAAGRAAYACRCRRGWMGARCGQQRNPCVQLDRSANMSGNVACRVHLNNQCVPTLGTDHYECRCVAGQWRHDVYFRAPNCRQRVSACDTQLCRNFGACHASPDGRRAVCVCLVGWRGAACDAHDYSVWLPWEPWARCGAACETGWSARRRQCRHNNASRCDGNAQELRLCQNECGGVGDRYSPIALMLLVVVAFSFLSVGSIFVFRLLIFKLFEQGKMKKD